MITCKPVVIVCLTSVTFLKVNKCSDYLILMIFNVWFRLQNATWRKFSVPLKTGPESTLTILN